MHKLTFESVAADVARTTATAEANGVTLNWKEPKPLTPREKIEALAAELRRDDLNPSVRAALIAERAQLEQLKAPRTGRATWGTRDAVEYRPRWKTDHHPWAVIGPSGEPNGIRYANHEVEED